MHSIGSNKFGGFHGFYQEHGLGKNNSNSKLDWLTSRFAFVVLVVLVVVLVLIQCKPFQAVHFRLGYIVE